MDLGELKDAFRLEADDGATPYLFSDAEVLRWLNDAEREACIRADLLYSETETVICNINVVSGTSVYALDEVVYRVENARLTDGTDTWNLKVVDRKYLDDRNPNWRELLSTQPSYLINDPLSVQVVGIPQSALTLKMGVYHYPLFSMEVDGDTPTIHVDHHERLINWALHRAYSKYDAETYDKDLADKYEARFTRDFGVRPDANVRGKQRMRRTPTVKSSW